MFQKNFDLLSPPITLYYKGENIHPSFFSAILSIIVYTFIFIFGVYYSLAFINKDNPTAYFFNRYIEDAGNYPINSTSLFHFIQLITSGSLSLPKAADLSSITIYGYEETIENIMVKNDPMQFNHWVYGKCNNDSDTKGIAYLINHNLYEEALCIRKYYDLSTDSYYETSDEKFRWPSADKGCSHHERTFYGIILEKCKNNTARKRAGFEYVETLKK